MTTTISKDEDPMDVRSVVEPNLPSAERPEMTPTQARTYLLNGGTTCPFCDSPAIEGTELTVDEGVCTQGISCTECGRQWTDVYRLVGVANERGERIEANVTISD